jgi:hypothetical protein
MGGTTAPLACDDLPKTGAPRLFTQLEDCMSNLPDYLLSAVVTCVGALFTYLVKSYFDKIQKSIDDLAKEVSKMEGKSDMLQGEIRNNIIESTKLRGEVGALWRFVDNSFKRPSDGGIYDRDAR